jgi:hypothetical protein
MAGRLTRPTSPINNKIFITNNEFLYNSLNTILAEEFILVNYNEDLDILLRGKNSHTNITFLFDLIKSAKENKELINRILAKNNFPKIPQDLSSNEINSVKINVFCFENSDVHESIIDSLIEQYNSEDIKREYCKFHEQLCSISKKPKNGIEQSYKNILPALYSKDFGQEVFCVLFKTKYKIAIDTLNGG